KAAPNSATAAARNKVQTCSYRSANSRCHAWEIARAATRQHSDRREPKSHDRFSATPRIRRLPLSDAIKEPRHPLHSENIREPDLKSAAHAVRGRGDQTNGRGDRKERRTDSDRTCPARPSS